MRIVLEMFFENSGKNSNITEKKFNFDDIW